VDWFKHLTCSHEDPDISESWDLFGPIGPMLFWVTCELYGREFNRLNGDGELSLSWRYYLDKVRTKRPHCQLILNWFQSRGRFDIEMLPDRIKIKIPKFLELSSNWTKRTKVAPTEAPTEAPTAKEEEVRSKNKNKKENKTYSELFLNFWEQYPNKKGKEEAFKAWKKHTPDMEVVIKAVKAQKQEKADLTLAGKFCSEWPNASTWLNNKRWEDEIQKIEPPKIEGDYPRAEDVLKRQGFTEKDFTWKNPK
jgi:hypothetical protein